MPMSRSMRGLTAWCLWLSLGACSGPMVVQPQEQPRPQPPLALLQPTPEPACAVVRNWDLAECILALRLSLRECEADKAGIAQWASEPAPAPKPRRSWWQWRSK